MRPQTPVAAAELAPAPVGATAPAPPAEGDAGLLDRGYLAACLRVLAGGRITPHGCQTYLDRIAAGATDPVERMLLEQTALAHVQLARLRATLAAAEGDDAIDRLSGAVARLAAEFRRTAATVEEYRGARAARLGTA